MKKKIYLPAIVIVFFVTPSFAQIKKGAIYLGGDVGGSTQKTTYNNSANTDKQNGFFFSPVFGKAIKENLVFGANASVNMYNNKTTGTNDENRQNSYGFGVFLRKYKPVGKSGFLLFAQAGLGYSYFRNKITPLDPGFSNYKRNNVSLNVIPGLSYSLSKKLQLETGLANLLSINYFTEKRDMGGVVPVSAKTNGFGISSSIDGTSSIYVGFRLLIN